MKKKLFSSGIRMNWFNVLLIAVGLLLAIALVLSTGQIRSAFRTVFSVTDQYLASQQTTGMLDSLSASILQECLSFLDDGEPGHVFAIEGQRAALNGQLAATAHLRNRSEITEALQHQDAALSAFWELDQMETRALRLHAETLRVPLQAYPAFLQEAELSEADAALSPEEKRQAARDLLSSETFINIQNRMSEEINQNHQKLSQEATADFRREENLVQSVLKSQMLLIIFVILLAVLALLANRFLMIRPIQESIGVLDRREPIPVKGSYEVRHLAEAYNAVLKDNVEKQEALSYTASHDALTGVLNRAAFESAYKACSADEHGGLIIVDVDRFKHFNDEFGHDVGDHVLVTVAQTIQAHFREEDILCRIGGDEFVILMRNTGLSHADVLHAKIDLINAELTDASGKDRRSVISISAGMAFKEQLREGQDLFKCADTALLRVKGHGKTACGLYDPEIDIPREEADA